MLCGAMASAQGIRVTVDGQPVEFPGIGPQMQSGRVLVPVRGVFQHMGATVGWHPASKMVTAQDDDTKITLYINSKTAYVNGRVESLDVPAQLIAGRTVVPLRFLSEALGAEVKWDEDERMVMIDTNRPNTGRVEERNQMRRFVLIESGTVIPVRLDEEISSNQSKAGERFMATLRQDDTQTYAGLPWGTRVEGKIVTARARRGSDPGLLELEFDRLVMPDGSTHRISGSLISLDSDSVTRQPDGRIVARSDKKDDRLVYAGIGAAGGLIVGILTKKPLEGTILGGILGYLYGENKRKGESQVSDVTLRRGTEFGVRLDQDVRVRQS